MSTKSLAAIGAIIVVALVGGALIISNGDKSSDSSAQTPAASSTSQSENSSSNNSTAAQEPISKTELAAADGKNGNKCYVAVDGKVYEIKNNPQWNSKGQHTPSEGQAYCGADMTDTIDKAPHGRSTLQQLTIVGSLQ